MGAQQKKHQGKEKEQEKKNEAQQKKDQGKEKEKEKKNEAQQKKDQGKEKEQEKKNEAQQKKEQGKKNEWSLLSARLDDCTCSGGKDTKCPCTDKDGIGGCCRFNTCYPGKDCSSASFIEEPEKKKKR